MNKAKTSRPYMLFTIKFIHSAAFVVVSIAILYVWYAIVTNSTDLLALAIGVILMETSIYILNGLRCPLTSLAQRYGDARGDDFIADLFLPEWFIPLIPTICGGLAALGMAVLLLRVLTS